MRLLYFFIVLLISYVSLAQETITIDLPWGETATKVSYSNGYELDIPTLEASHIGADGPIFIKYWDRSEMQDVKLSIESVEYEKAPKTDLNAITTLGWDIHDSVQFKVKNIKKRDQAVAALELSPYVKNGSSVERISKIVFQKITVSSHSQMKTGHVFAENSVLAPGSGDWYKIKVQADGVHRITYDFLKDIGIDIDNINPQSINIYGNGFGRLPENNSEYRPDDLLKNAILIQGEADGSFDPNDFILFYGRGPHKWEDAGSTGFRRTLNNYATYSAYYINVNPSESPKRIQNAITSNQPETHTVNEYNSYTIHERELVNLIKGGQRWYGEEFDAELSRNFSFNIPNLNPAQPVIIRSAMACKDGSASGTNYQLRYNGSLLGTASMAQTAADSWRRANFTTAPGTFTPTSGNFNLQVTFNRSNPGDRAHLDFIEINARSFLSFNGNQFQFRDKNSVGTGNIAQFEISNFPQGGEVWETTELANPRLVNGAASGGTFTFKVETDSLRTFIGFNNSGYLTPSFEKKIEHQNLHSLPQVDYLIVTNKLFLSEANRLAQLHANNGVSSHVVTLEKMYNEFSGGTQDPTAIKFFTKMFFDRAEGDPDEMPKYLMLFGDGTYDPLDRVPDNNYMCPVYHTVSSEGYITTLVSDDYFGFLDENEAFSPSDVLDIAVGRLIATTPEHATDLVNKIEHYMKNGSSIYASAGLLCGEDGFISTQGDWRLRYTTIADDKENGYFINNDLEPAYEHVNTSHPEMNPNKIYSDAFQKVSTAGGERFPEVNREINRSIESGSILTCFVGHGGAAGAAQERIITIGQINEWTNIDKLTLFVSATCEFARIDDNEFVSAGEWMALNPIGGAIALMTTTRAVYFSTNSETTARFFENVFLRDTDQQPRTFGEIITGTKNQTPGGGNNKRSFMLLGDPALRIALPYEKVVLDSLNGNPINIVEDTLKALSKARLTGHLEDQFGNQLAGFNGIMQPSIFDKPQVNNTLGQSTTSPIIEFLQQKSVLYRGKVSVTNGVFDFDFIVPKDIDYAFGNGKASFYAFDEAQNSAGGYDKSIIVGGVDTTGLDDNIGPEIDLFLNDEDFVNGGLTNETPILIAKLFDDSGINTVGNGIGHDITVILDDKTDNAKVLNDFYEADLDTYQSGSLRYQFEELEPGLHTLTFKAWDVNNNSSEETLEFNVQEQKEIALKHVLNYPNPFTTNTSFMFEHNQVCAALETKIEIFTVTGRLVKTIFQDVKTQGFRVEGIAWDGKDDFGDQLAKGVYVYRINVRNPEGETAQEMQKLYLLK